MDRKKFQVPPAAKQAVTIRISHFLSKTRPEISFAYLHGSFMEERPFGDIDVAVFLSVPPEKNPLQYEIELEVLLEEAVRYPVDVRILNTAPLSFRFNVLRHGRLLFERDCDSRVEFQTRTLMAYFDFAPLRRQYLEEALGIEI